MMKIILDQLHEDHRNFSKLLNLLDRQIAIFEDGDRPNYEIVNLILQYMLEYPDRCHHPYEDALYKAIVTKKLAKASEVQNLEIAHIQLNALTKSLASIIDNVILGVELPRQTVVDAGREYVRAYRQHFEMEEAHFLPLVAKALGPEDWSDIMISMADDADPLFGNGDRSKYRALRKEIEALARGEN